MEDNNIDDDLLDIENNDDNSYGDGVKYDNAIMSQFYDLENQRKLIELKWRGKTKRNKTFVKSGDPIGSDSFVDNLMVSLQSLMTQHNSISTLRRQDANNLLYENIYSFCDLCLNSPGFNEESFLTVGQEFDNMQQIFMGHVIDGHGLRGAQGLQAGVVAENKIKSSKQESFMDIGMDILKGGINK